MKRMITKSIADNFLFLIAGPFRLWNWAIKILIVSVKCYALVKLRKITYCKLCRVAYIHL